MPLCNEDIVAIGQEEDLLQARYLDNKWTNLFKRLCILR